MSEISNTTKVNRWEQSKPGEPYWHEGATDPGADYRPSKPQKTETTKPKSGPEKSKPGEPYWHEGATDPGAYSLTNTRVNARAELHRNAMRFAASAGAVAGCPVGVETEIPTEIPPYPNEDSNEWNLPPEHGSDDTHEESSDYDSGRDSMEPYMPGYDPYSDGSTQF